MEAPQIFLHHLKLSISISRPSFYNIANNSQPSISFSGRYKEANSAEILNAITNNKGNAGIKARPVQQVQVSKFGRAGLEF